MKGLSVAIWNTLQITLGLKCYNKIDFPYFFSWLDNNIKGPSKNYVTARGGEGVDDFVTYRYVYFEGEGGYFMKLLRNGKWKIWELKAPI